MSPAALNAFGVVKESGHIGIETIAKHLNTITAKSFASDDKLKNPHKNGTAKNKNILPIQSPIYANFKRRLEYILA